VDTVDPSEHLDPTEEITLDVVKNRAVKGVVVLTGRTFLLSVLSLVATGFLTVFLDPSQFGIFWIVSAIVNFLAYFSDVGLAAALIQKRETPTESDLRTTFVVQQLLVLLILAIIFLGMPFFTHIYHLTSEAKYLLYALGISLIFSSLKTIPSVLMERDLQFGKLVIPQVAENLVYNLVAVVLAWKGLGVTSFTIAVLVRGVVGLIIIYILKPWVPGFSLSIPSLKKLLSYGVPYQGNTLLAMLKDDGMTAFLGTILGPAGIGYLGWAQKWGYAPLRFFMDQVVKVTFPAFARMQAEKEQLIRSVNRSIFFICILVFPTLIGLLIIAPTLVKVIPRYGKWTPALLPLSLIGINCFFAAATTQLTNLLSSIGKIKSTFKLMVMWTVLTWVFVPALAYKFGVNGAAFGYSLIGVSSIVAIVVAKRAVNFSLMDSAVKPALAAFLMGGTLLIIRHYLSISFTSVWIMIGIGAFTYAISMFLLVGVTLIADVKKSFFTLFSK
jgi:O-antigen/teichoic acid export membrane protein